MRVTWSDRILVILGASETFILFSYNSLIINCDILCLKTLLNAPVYITQDAANKESPNIFYISNSIYASY